MNSYGSLPEYKLKAHIPNFHGGLQIEELLDWFYEVESFFNFIDVPDSSKVKLVTYKLKGGDAAWWDKLCDDRRKLSQTSLTQGARLVEEYIAELYSLVARNQLNESKEQWVARFIEGLNRLIQQGMTQSVYTMVESIQKSIKIERRVLHISRQASPRQVRYQHCYKVAKPYTYHYGNQSERGSIVVVDPHERNYGQPILQPQTTNFTSSQSPLPADTAPLMSIPSVKPSQVTQRRDVAPTTRGNKYEKQFPPLSKSPNPYSKFQGDICNKCNQTGHTSSDFRKFHAYINETQEETQVEDALEEDELTYLQEHETYDADFLGVIRPILIFEPCLTQRHNIFKSHCLIEEQLCSMIIDSGSTENYVSAKLVENLVYLYEDSALCDVINMNAASLLLGKPLQYDIRAVHNCYENTYTFVHEGFTKVLWPLKSSISVNEPADKKTTALVATVVHSLKQTHSLRSHEFIKPMVDIPDKEEHLSHLSQVFKALHDNFLYVNLKKCAFFTNRVTFLGYIVSDTGISVDDAKIKEIIDWPIPTSIRENEDTDKSFNLLKEKLCSAPVHAMPNFDKPFEIHCDASIVGINVVLSQDAHPIAYYSKKNSDTRKKFSTYELELISLVHALKNWHPYLIHNEFIVNTDNRALKFLKTSAKVNRIHDRWLSTINQYTFSIKHQSGKLNQVADALSRRAHLLVTLKHESLDFDFLKDIYSEDKDFQNLWENGLGGHFVRAKTIALVEER
ncbi:uncharacterized protein LOC113272732 [Papaver somniferum]|uniref:uncharacterized protein LOC113272732 n=1 Tax=Papaver somniferum TaxID=3469 RepID=UPI000E701099|nr:uncharacterized protein LOC113272732 [Papaver somniferum]